MNWSIIGTIAVKAIPAAIKFAEGLHGKNGKEKLEQSVEFINDEIFAISLKKDIADDLRVREAVEHALEAAVCLQNTIAIVEKEHNGK